MCLCLLGIALALLVQPSTAWVLGHIFFEGFRVSGVPCVAAAQDFARGVPGLKEHEVPPWMFLFCAECQDSILAQFSELPAGASRLHFGSLRQNGTRCMPESLGAPGLRKRTPPTRSLFASFAGCRQDNTGQAWGTRASGLNVGLVGYRRRPSVCARCFGV